MRALRAAVILALYAALAGGVLVAGAVVVPSMAKQVARLANEAPRYAQDLRRHYIAAAVQIILRDWWASRDAAPESP